MKLEILFTCGESLFIPDCCEHDLAKLVDAMNRHHTFWLRRRKVPVVVINGSAIVVGDISAVSLVEE